MHCAIAQAVDVLLRCAAAPKSIAVDSNHIDVAKRLIMWILWMHIVRQCVAGTSQVGARHWHIAPLHALSHPPHALQRGQHTKAALLRAWLSGMQPKL